MAELNPHALMRNVAARAVESVRSRPDFPVWLRKRYFEHFIPWLVEWRADRDATASPFADNDRPRSRPHPLNIGWGHTGLLSPDERLTIAAVRVIQLHRFEQLGTRIVAETDLADQSLFLRDLADGESFAESLAYWYATLDIVPIPNATRYAESEPEDQLRPTDADEMLAMAMDAIPRPGAVETAQGIAAPLVSNIAPSLTIDRATERAPEKMARVLVDGGNNGDAKPPDISAGIALTSDHESVLAVFGKSPTKCKKVHEVASAGPIRNRETVGRLLRELAGFGLVNRPHGVPKGYALTDAGRKRLPGATPT